MSDTPNNAALLAELSALTAEVRAIRAEQAALTARSSAFTAIQTGEAVYPAKPSFTPLDSKVLNAVAAAAGISLERSVGFSLQFREPGLVVAVAEYHVPADAFAAAIGAISALPKEQQPEPIGMDELGFPIFAEAPSPAEARQPAPPPAGSAPTQ